MNETTAAKTVFYSIMPSPIGELMLSSDGEAITGITMVLERGKPAQAPKPEWRRDDAVLRPAPATAGLLRGRAVRL